MTNRNCFCYHQSVTGLDSFSMFDPFPLPVCVSVGLSVCLCLTGLSSVCRYKRESV